MNIALIRYNLSYYFNSLKCIAPSLVYLLFFFINYQSSPIGIWSNCYVSAMAVYVMSIIIGTSFINSEDRIQQSITRLHVKDDTVFHLAKYISVVIFTIPFYIISIFYPIIFGLYSRDLLPTEIVAFLLIHFTYSIQGIAVGVFFNTYIFKDRNSALPIQVLIIVITALPLSYMFKSNVLITYASYLLPPVNFITEMLFGLDDAVFIFDPNFWFYIVYSLGYTMMLVTVYIFIIKKKCKI